MHSHGSEYMSFTLECAIYWGISNIIDIIVITITIHVSIHHIVISLPSLIAQKRHPTHFWNWCKLHIRGVFKCIKALREFTHGRTQPKYENPMSLHIWEINSTNIEAPYSHPWMISYAHHHITLNNKKLTSSSREGPFSMFVSSRVKEDELKWGISKLPNGKLYVECAHFL